MSALKASVLLAMVLTFGGCASAGRPSLDPVTLLNIMEQNVTLREVEQMLGKPDDAATGANGKTLIVYGDYDRDWRLMKGEVGIEFRSAYFLFNEQGVLEKKLVSETGTTIVSKGSAAMQGRPIGEAQLQKLKLKETRYEEVLNILGPPLTESLTLDGEILREWVFWRDLPFLREESQTLTGIFDYDRDVLQDFFFRDDLLPEKKRSSTE